MDTDPRLAVMALFAFASKIANSRGPCGQRTLSRQGRWASTLGMFHSTQAGVGMSCDASSLSIFEGAEQSQGSVPGKYGERVSCGCA